MGDGVGDGRWMEMATEIEIEMKAEVAGSSIALLSGILVCMRRSTAQHSAHRGTSTIPAQHSAGVRARIRRGDIHRGHTDLIMIRHGGG